MNNVKCYRGLSLALSLVLALGLLPTAALAAGENGLCKHHPIHTEDCGHGGNSSCDFAVKGCELCREDAEESVTTIKGTDVTISGYSFPYTGDEIRPEVTVAVNGVTLAEGTHYQLTYKDNIAAGTASVTVTGLPEAGYDGIVTIPFTIEGLSFTLTPIKGTDVVIDGTEFVYTGQPIEPAVTVTVEGKVLTEGTDYSLDYENNVQPGTATLTVTGIATASMTQGYTGEVSIDFTIVQKQDAPEDSDKPEDTDKPEDSEKPGDTDKPEDTDKPGDSEEETKPVEYKITKGDRATWFQNSGKRLSFVTNGSEKNFTGISVNGKGLGKSYYTVSGDTVTLNTAFLNRLTVGKYSIAVHFADGDAEGTFFVSDKLDVTNPVTGDSRNVGLFLFTGFAALSALAGAAFVSKRMLK